ncbi:VOC family protein [Vibrio lentus]|uniref:VOC family protein n=1 Tax=Vibrio lentus TaxID=136468 RepID=UPI000C84645D|nr:VOC family protein [Vibrio lentus]PMJ04516.1 hypothetical protein BCU32_03155 [Vibrio lentus]
MLENYIEIDHIAIAVNDLDEAIEYYEGVAGLSFEKKLSVQGENSGMISAIMKGNNFSFVLLQSTSEGSQIDEYIKKYGPGVQHVAIRVNKIEQAYDSLKDNQVDFSTNIIESPGLKQAFTNRDDNSGVMIELIERNGLSGFASNNVKDLFSQLENRGTF